MKAGAVVVPLNVLLKRRELAYHLGDADVKAHFFQATSDPEIGAEGHARSEHVDGCEYFGHAKNAELSHMNTMINVVTINRMFKNEPASDTHVLTLPLFHTLRRPGTEPGPLRRLGRGRVPAARDRWAHAASELDAKRAIRQGVELAAAL